MNTEQLQQLKTMVQDAGDLPEAAREELLKRVTTTQQEAAEEASVPEDYMGRLTHSVQELEASHPEATAFMNRIAAALGNMGI